MHFTKLPLFLTTFSLSILSTSAALSPICTAIQDLVPSHLDTIPALFKSHVCSAGCKPTITDMEQFIGQTLVPEIVTTAMQKMELGSFGFLAEGIARDIATKVEEKVEAEAKAANVKGTDLCGGDADTTLDVLVESLKQNLGPVVLTYLDQFSAFVTDGMCLKLRDYLTGAELWEGTVPAALDGFAGTCEK